LSRALQRRVDQDRGRPIRDVKMPQRECTDGLALDQGRSVDSSPGPTACPGTGGGSSLPWRRSCSS